LVERPKANWQETAVLDERFDAGGRRFRFPAFRFSLFNEQASAFHIPA